MQFAVSQSLERGHGYLSPEHAKKRRQPPSKRTLNAPNKQLLLDQVTESLISQLYARPNPKPYHSCTTLNESFGGVDAFKSSVSLHSGSSGTLVDSAPGAERISPCTDNDKIAQQLSCDDLFGPEQFASPPSPPSTDPKRPQRPSVFSLDDFSTMAIIKRLATRYGRVSHMGMLDRSYSFFVNQRRTAALSYKVQNKVAIVAGDPLCDPTMFTDLLFEFERYRKEHQWSIAYMGASEIFADYAKQRGWTTLEFAKERVLNPMTNEVLLERSGKRMVTQNKQLLNPTKSGITLGLYVPAQGGDPILQKELVAIYDAWRLERNQTSKAQAFITVYDPFSLPHMMTYLYTRGPDGVANGFAALRKIGANKGYHIDPCIAAPGAPKGISDLLVFSAMAFLNHGNISYLSLGFEPLDTLGQMTGVPRPLEKVTRALHRRTFQRLPLGGKKAYHDKFKPDQQKESSLYLIFPTGVLNPRQVVAMAHMANISIRKLVFADDKEIESKQPKATKGQTASSQET